MTRDELKDYYRKYSRERYEWRKSKGICTYCGQEKAADGRTMCQMCLLNLRKKSARRRRNANPEQKEQIKQYKHKYYEKFIESGICPRCRIRPLQKDRKLCNICLEEKRQAAKERREAAKKGLETK